MIGLPTQFNLGAFLMNKAEPELTVRYPNTTAQDAVAKARADAMQARLWVTESKLEDRWVESPPLADNWCPVDE